MSRHTGSVESDDVMILSSLLSFLYRVFKKSVLISNIVMESLSERECINILIMRGYVDRILIERRMVIGKLHLKNYPVG